MRFQILIRPPDDAARYPRSGVSAGLRREIVGVCADDYGMTDHRKGAIVRPALPTHAADATDAAVFAVMAKQH